VSIEGQRAQKVAIVRESLARLGGLRDVPFDALVPSPKSERYRRRLRGQLAKQGFGFSARASTKVVPVPACLLVEEAVERLATDLADACKRLKLQAFSAFAVDASEDGRGVAHVEFREKVTPMVKSAAARLLGLVRGLGGLVLTGPGGAAQTVGDPVLVDRGHHGLRVRPDLFAQANRLGARQLAADVAAGIDPGASVLELFCGAGTLTLPLSARAGTLVATEGAGPSLELLKLSLADLGRTARVESGRAEAVVSRLVDSGTRFDHVVLDPPRAGAKECVPSIVASGASHVTYVSCDPASFARDAAMLVRSGFTLDRVTPYDLFPHTHHVELVGRFSRAG